MEVGMSEIDRMLAANEDWAQRFPGSKDTRPARHDAHVIRNAGGVITEDVVRSLTVSQHVLGTREILLVHHTQCGLQATDDNSFADLVEEATGRRPAWALRAFKEAEA